MSQLQDHESKVCCVLSGVCLPVKTSVFNGAIHADGQVLTSMQRFPVVVVAATVTRDNELTMDQGEYKARLQEQGERNSARTSATRPVRYSHSLFVISSKCTRVILGLPSLMFVFVLDDDDADEIIKELEILLRINVENESKIKLSELE